MDHSNDKSSCDQLPKPPLVKMTDRNLNSNHPTSPSTNEYFNASNFLPIIANMRPTMKDSNSISYISNRSFETTGESTSSLESSPSSMSVNNSIECKNDRWLSKGSSFLKMPLNLLSNKKYSPGQEDWKNRNLTDNSSAESFRYTTSTRQLDQLDNDYLDPTKVNTNFIKSFSFNNFNHFRKYSVDANLVSLGASSRFVSQRRRFTKAYASNASLKLSKNFDDVSKPRYSHAPEDSEANSSYPKDSPDRSSFSKRKSTAKVFCNISNFTRLQKLTLACILIVSFCSYCSMSILAPFYPKKAEQKGLSETQAGFVFSVAPLISSIFSPVLGKCIIIFFTLNEEHI